VGEIDTRGRVDEQRVGRVEPALLGDAQREHVVGARLLAGARDVGRVFGGAALELEGLERLGVRRGGDGLAGGDVELLAQRLGDGGATEGRALLGVDHHDLYVGQRGLVGEGGGGEAGQRGRERQRGESQGAHAPRR
jgi:hypothetical protein